MKIELLVASIALTCTTVAAPVPGMIQAHLERLEVNILDVISDIGSRGGSNMHLDFHAGVENFHRVLERLSGAISCGSLPSYQADSEADAILVLQGARQELLTLANDITTNADMEESSIYSDICRAYDRYRAAHPYIKSL